MDQVETSASSRPLVGSGRAISEVAFPIAAGIVFFVGVAALVWLSASASGVATTYSPLRDYQLAVYASMSPTPDGVSRSLYKLDRPTLFVTWTKAQWVSSFQRKSPTEEAKAGTDIWVTDSESLKKFCRDFVKTHGPNEPQLALRLRQRLGLPQPRGVQVRSARMRGGHNAHQSAADGGIKDQRESATNKWPKEIPPDPATLESAIARKGRIRLGEVKESAKHSG